MLDVLTAIKQKEAEAPPKPRFLGSKFKALLELNVTIQYIVQTAIYLAFKLRC